MPSTPSSPALLLPHPDMETLCGYAVALLTMILAVLAGALRTEQIRNCVIMTGPITGGCLMEGATDCVFHMVSI